MSNLSRVPHRWDAKVHGAKVRKVKRIERHKTEAAAFRSMIEDYKPVQDKAVKKNRI